MIIGLTNKQVTRFIGQQVEGVQRKRWSCCQYKQERQIVCDIIL